VFFFQWGRKHKSCFFPTGKKTLSYNPYGLLPAHMRCHVGDPTRAEPYGARIGHPTTVTKETNNMQTENATETKQVSRKRGIMDNGKITGPNAIKGLFTLKTKVSGKFVVFLEEICQETGKSIAYHVREALYEYANNLIGEKWENYDD
jgi:hypothetical protein